MLTTADTERGSRLREQIRQALNSQRQPTITVLSSLLAVQDSIHYLPDEAINETATFCGSTINEVWSVASFYTNFRFTPPAEHTLEVCWGPSCHVRGAPEILRAVMDYLHLTAEGEATSRGISFKYNTCLGACAHAPVMSVDHHLVGRLTVQEALKRVRRMRREGGADGAQ